MTTFCAANSNGFDCCVRALNTPRSVTNENVETDDAADFDNRLRERVSECAFHAGASLGIVATGHGACETKGDVPARDRGP